MQEQSSFDAPPGAVEIACPDFDFMSLPLSQASRQQLAKVHHYTKQGGKALRSRCGLLHLINRERLNTALATYIPQSDNLYLTGKQPDLSAPAQPAYFSNALLLSDRFDQGHLDWTKLPPSHRLTNIGVLFVTHEHDCTSAEEIDEVLSWMRGENGNFSNRASLTWIARFLPTVTIAVTALSTLVAAQFSFTFCSPPSTSNMHRIMPAPSSVRQ